MILITCLLERRKYLHELQDYQSLPRSLTIEKRGLSNPGMNIRGPFGSRLTWMCPISPHNSIPTTYALFTTSTTKWLVHVWLRAMTVADRIGLMDHSKYLRTNILAFFLSSYEGSSFFLAFKVQNIYTHRNSSQ